METPACTMSNFLDIDQEISLFAIILISTEVQYSVHQNGLNHTCASNFPIHLLMGFLAVHFQISVPHDTVEISRIIILGEISEVHEIVVLIRYSRRILRQLKAHHFKEV